MKYYKLTNQNYETTNQTKWGVGITHKATGKGRELCTSDVIHVYDHPLKAVMFNPIHANIANPVLWEVRVKKIVAKDLGKAGVKECTTIKIVPLPEITTQQRVRFAIYCALEVYHGDGFVTWAQNWLSGKDTSYAAARAAAKAAAYAADYAAYAADYAIDFVALIKRAIC